MWRAAVLALAASTICQLFSPAPAWAVDSKGQWEAPPRFGWGDIAPYGGMSPPNTGDCVVDVVDMQSISYRYGAFCTLAAYHRDYDLHPDLNDGIINNNDDCDIDIADLQTVAGRDGAACVAFWDPDVSMGEYSYRGSTPTGSFTQCRPTAKTPPGRDYYVDPITMVFTHNATDARLEQVLPAHGLPELEHDGEQRFWEVGRCTFEDVDARYDRPWTCGPIDSCEAWHVRAEVGDQEGQAWPHVIWGRFAVATPHFDDDCSPWGHFVPEVFPYPNEVYPGFSGSGFDAGREWLIRRLGGHYSVEYWGNRAHIRQGCDNTQYPRSNGWVIFKRID